MMHAVPFSMTRCITGAATAVYTLELLALPGSTVSKVLENMI